MFAFIYPLKSLIYNLESIMPPKETEEKTAHNEVTLALAKQECAEHMEGMEEASAEMRKRPLRVKAYSLDDSNAPSGGENVKTVHFVRHGQGFHNLLADMAKKEGRKWVQVCFVLFNFILFHCTENACPLICGFNIFPL